MKTRLTILSLLCMVLLLAFHAGSADPLPQPVAVGKVQWGRDLDAALRASRESGKPVFLLFQEVPGCSGCQQFGREVLSDEQVMKAISTNFIPLLIHNNKSGADADVLRRFHEPAWNYQVVRFIDAEGNDLIPRKDRVWTKPELMERMKQALEVSRKATPPVSEDGTLENPITERIVFAQSCFWTGEMRLGQIAGVVTTEAGYLHGREVTMVTFNSRQIDIGTLIQRASSAGCADAIYVTTPAQAEIAAREGNATVSKLDPSYRKAPASDQKKQIQSTPFAQLDLTEEQATKVNAFARVDTAKALEFITPEQKSKLYAEKQKN